MPSRVCVIIPTVRNSDELGITLDGLANQTYDDMEVVVVGPRDDKGKVEAKSRGSDILTTKGLVTEQMLAM